MEPFTFLVTGEKMSKDSNKQKTPKEQDAPAAQGALEKQETSSEDTVTEKKPVSQDALPALGKLDTHRVLCSSITSRRGVLVEGQGCRSNDFPGGETQLAEMLTKKLIKKV